MNTSTRMLFAGHEDLNQRLLPVLQRQLDAFERARTPDLRLMRDIVDGLNRYIATGERILIDDLARKNDAFAVSRVVLMTEHQLLIELGDRCLAVIDDILEGRIVSRASLTVPLGRLLVNFRDHLEREHSDVHRHEPLPVQQSTPAHSSALSFTASTTSFGDLRDRIDRATATIRRDTAGRPVCPACSVDNDGDALD